MLRWLRCWRRRDDQLLIGPPPLADVEPLNELIRVVNEAQEGCTRDERCLIELKFGNGLHLLYEDGPSKPSPRPPPLAAAPIAWLLEAPHAPSTVGSDLIPALIAT